MFKLSDPIIEKPADTEPTNAEIIAEIKKTSKRCLRVARKKGNELNISKKWRLDVKIKFDRKGSRSHGWGSVSSGWVTIRPNYHVSKETVVREYAAITNDPTIGGFESSDWRVRVNRVVCHEIAHALQGMMSSKKKWYYLSGWKANVDWGKPHGQGWRRLYAMLRREIVNPYI